MHPTASQIRRQFIDFFVKKYSHKEIPSASLIPENDPTVLFTTAGMHPLVPYLMGERHPAGTRLVNIQKCLRTDDIDEVGDTTHLTFFEMLGNWSLGDYFKEEAIKMSFELLTLAWERGGFGLDSKRIWISCFEGDKDAPRDNESVEIWKAIGIPEERIGFYPKSKNWWGPAGQTGPCGPDTEMFYDTIGSSDFKAHKKGNNLSAEAPTYVGEKTCHQNCDCGRYVEIWNDVFMQYNKKTNGTFEPLKQKNVDTGLGFERLVAILHGKPSHYSTELFAPVMEKIKELSRVGQEIEDGYIRSSRIIADHLRAATFILGDSLGVTPSNLDQGYIVRRLIRRAIRHGKLLGIEGFFTSNIAKLFIPIYGEIYPELRQNHNRIINELDKEEERFSRTIEKGLKEMKRILEKKKAALTGEEAFYIFETYGFPFEMIEEELLKEGFPPHHAEFKTAFDEAFKRHQADSRAGAEKKFSGGLADQGEQTTKHHTATHLLHQALREVLGPHVAQKGSNVTAERLRFDFSHPTKMTPEQIAHVEKIVNEQIARDLPVHFEMLTVEEAKAKGAIGLFEDKYATLGNKVAPLLASLGRGINCLASPRRTSGLGLKVKVYFIGDFSKEICGGPHVAHTGALKSFKILKEEASSAGVRRIKAVALNH